jgi:poly-gamma-glutamate synthesis protein (capsule biosynthesis protein)
MRGEPQFAAALQRVGFNVLNVANNHAVQHGDETFHRTLAAVREAGIACVGVRGTGSWASEPALLCGGRVGVLGYCQRPRQWGTAIPPYAEGTREEICADVRRLRETGAIVIVSLHWGEEFVPEPSNSELQLGHDIIDAGANLILGHHPHVTRPAESYKHAVIVHSLGNFMGDMTWYKPFRTGAIFRCGLSVEGVSHAHVTPTKLGNDYHPQPSPPDIAPCPTSQMRAMDEAAYHRAIARTWRDQRLAGYSDMLANLRRIPFPILMQLTTETAKNKIAAAVARVTGRAASP